MNSFSKVKSKEINLSEGIDELKKVIDAINQETEAGEKLYIKLKKVLSLFETELPTENNLPSVGTGVESIIKEGNVEKEKVEVTYFSMPESDGSFLCGNGVEEDNGRKYFRVEFEKGSSMGKLYFVSQGKNDGKAINRHQSYLRPVCSIENYEDMAQARNVECISPGEVIRHGDSWVLDFGDGTKESLHKNKVQVRLLV